MSAPRPPRVKARCKNRHCLSDAQAKGYCYQHYESLRRKRKLRVVAGVYKDPEAKARAWREAKRLRYSAPACPEICERPGCGRRASCLDHDHNTGAFRGWLCKSCNTAIGALGDDIDGMYAAIRYLERRKGESDG